MDKKANVMTGKIKEVAILKGGESSEDRIEISEYLLQNLQFAMVLKRVPMSKETPEIFLTKETASQLSEILKRWSEGKI